MDDKEKIQSFADMVDATEKIAKPWRKFCAILAAVALVTNILWCIIVGMLVHYAYMTPVDVNQEQFFEGQQQEQSYTSGVTGGK